MRQVDVQQDEIPLSDKLKYLGPGLLMAGAAIGVSHLIQSTRAGADYGFSLVILVILVNILKYPFFEYGHRYVAYTGENLLQGYKKLGKRYLYLFIFLNILTAIISIAGVTFVTSALASLLFPDHLDSTELSVIIMAFCAGLIFLGHYRLLDWVMKGIMLVLCTSTLFAFVMVIAKDPTLGRHYVGPSPWTWSAFPFLIALMGWMPAPIELSVWQSLWMQAKNKHVHTTVPWARASFDFNFGYMLTLGLALIFVSLGALVMYGTGKGFSNSGPVFANQLIQMYTSVLGEWAKPVLSIAVLCTMFSTTLTVIDAYPRSLAEGFKIAFTLNIAQRHLQWLWILVGCALALIIIHNFMNHFKQLVDLAASIAFIAAPIFACLNYKLILSEHTPLQAKPSTFMKGLSLLGIGFLSLVALVYIAMLLFF